MSQQLKHLRDNKKVKLLRESIKRRFLSEEPLDKVLEMDSQLLKLLSETNVLGRERAELSRKMKGSSKQDKIIIIQNMKEKAKVINEIVSKRTSLEKEINNILYHLPNFIDLNVLVEKSEDKNRIITKYGEPIDLKEGQFPDYELLDKINGYDSVRGVKVAGHRGYFLKAPLMELNMALISYAMDFLMEKKYNMMETPLFMKKSVMAKTAELKDFEDTLYTNTNKNEDRDIVFIATSEQPLSAYHSNEELNTKDLPLRYGGVSKCFRKEAGSHGKDTRGIFRVHQFDKIEQFVICQEDESETIHQELLKISEEFYQSLEIPYRVVEIVSGGLNLAAYKKYDLEGYFPSKGYRELVSCSNCLDYQSSLLKIRRLDGKKYHPVHLINGTLCATGRTLSILLEINQTSEGIKIPKILQKYMFQPKDIITFC